GSPGTFTLTAGGYPAPTFSAVGTLPSGVTLVGGVLSGTPAGGTGGSYPLALTATNGIGADATQTFSLTVDEAPSITSANNATFTVGAAGSFTVTATGTPTPTLGESGALPAGVTFDSSTGILSGTPSTHAGTTYALTFTAHNAIGSDSVQNFTLTVNEAPAITSDTSTSFLVGSAGSFTVTAGGFPAPTLSESPSDTLPGGVTFDPSSGLLSGTPDPGSAGDYTLNFTAHNSTQPDATQAFVLHVDQVLAFTSAGSTTFTVGSPGTPLTVQASGFPAPSVSLTGGTLPSGVTFDSGTGVLSGTPAVGTGGAYALTFTATDGVEPDAVQTFTLFVDEAPQITSPASVTFTTGVLGDHTVAATGYPLPGLSESGADVLPSGVAFDPSTGHLSGTPAAGTGNTYTLHFTASNQIGSDATQP
ncbi:MAG: putative Ig domain-containing protein, partial [Candidatus Dormibacteria bacterium]